MALKNANFGAIPLEWIGRTPTQMRVAAAFAAADRSNEFLILDDEGTPFHCPARENNPRGLFDLVKRAKLGRQACGCEKTVQNRCGREDA
jgi:hypothetical protein